jgi:hypothetical protein
VREAIARRYWPHEIEVLPVPYHRMLDAPLPPVKEAVDYRHVVGWLRRPA